jgi:hypothetical protein
MNLPSPILKRLMELFGEGDAIPIPTPNNEDDPMHQVWKFQSATKRRYVQMVFPPYIEAATQTFVYEFVVCSNTEFKPSEQEVYEARG